MSQVEFKLRVPIYDLEDDDKDCLEIQAIREAVGITWSGPSLGDQYDAFREPDSARYFGDPWARIGRGDIHLFLADQDEDSFLAIDLYQDCTDQMNTVELWVRCPSDIADRVSQLLRSIRQKAEVASALLEGDLGLRDAVSREKFPREVKDGGAVMIQHISIYHLGTLQATSHGAEQVAKPDRLARGELSSRSGSEWPEAPSVWSWLANWLWRVRD